MMNLKYVALLALVTAGSACEIAQPFQGPKWDPSKGLTDASLKGPFLAATTDIVVKSDANDLFNEDFNAVQDELKTSKGLIGYSLSFVVGGNDYRTLTVWETEEDMAAFVTSEAHAKAMADVGRIGQSGFVTSWQIEAKDMPPTFDDAKKELAKQGQDVTPKS